MALTGISYSFPAIQAVDADTIAGYYNARSSQALVASQTALASSSRGEAVTTPWDVGTTTEEASKRLQSALGAGSFIDEAGSVLSGEDPTEADTKLFTLYNALLKLSDIASHANDKTTSPLLLNSLNNRFQEGLSEILDYTSGINLTELAVVAGSKQSKADATIAVPRTTSSYQTKVVHNATTLTPMAGLDGTEVFTVSVKKSTGTTDVVVDLSELGTSNVLIDDLINLVNTKLQDAGFVTRMKRERVVTEDQEDDAVPPQAWALKFEGTATETLSFSAANANPAVYVAGTTGKPGSQAGQFLKIDPNGTEPVIAAAGRIETADVKEDQAKSSAIAIDAQGNTYMVSNTDGDVGSLKNKGDNDVVLTKYDSTGQLVWQRMLGTSDTAEGFSVAVDADDNVIVAGKATGSLVGGSAIGTNASAFVTKFDRLGQEIFTRHIGPFADDGATAVTTDAAGNIYFGGYTKGKVTAANTYGGGEDAFITKLSADGTLDYTRQFGGTGNERITGLAVGDDGNLVALVAEGTKAVVYKFDSADGTSGALWSQDLGDLAGGEAAALKAVGGTVYVGGSTSTASIGGGTVKGAYQGGSDGFVVEINDASGAFSATTFVGGASTDRIRGIDVAGGEIYVTGDATSDLGGGFSGTISAFTAKLDGTGGLAWVQQYAGREGQARASAIAVDTQGSSVLDVLGIPKGQLDYGEARTITAQSTVRAGDEFYISVDGKSKRKITIAANDTLNTLRFKINSVLLLDGEAKVRRVSGADSLRIEAKSGARIDLYSGADGKDALMGLGLEVGAIVDAPSLLDEAEEGEDTGPVYVALNLNGDYSLTSRESAGAAASAIQQALSAIRKGFRDLNKDPALEALLNRKNKASGPVPAYLTSQLANYQAGLSRLTGGSADTSLGLF